MYRKIPEENFRTIEFTQEEGFNLPLKMTVEGLDIAGNHKIIHSSDGSTWK